jgi:flagellar FliL protein
MAKKKIIIILVLLLVLGVGGGGAYTFMGKSNVVAGVVEKSSQAPKFGQFVKLDPFVLTVLRRGRRRKIVTFVITVELAENYDHYAIQNNMHRLRDAFLTELNLMIEFDWPDGRVIDLDRAKKRLREESRKVLGEPVIERILFESVQIRKV